MESENTVMESGSSANNEENLSATAYGDCAKGEANDGLARIYLLLKRSLVS